jgi:hypothetical protein
MILAERFTETREHFLHQWNGAGEIAAQLTHDAEQVQALADLRMILGQVVAEDRERVMRHALALVEAILRFVHPGKREFGHADQRMIGSEDLLADRDGAFEQRHRLRIIAGLIQVHAEVDQRRRHSGVVGAAQLFARRQCMSVCRFSVDASPLIIEIRGVIVFRCGTLNRVRAVTPLCEP